MYYVISRDRKLYLYYRNPNDNWTKTSEIIKNEDGVIYRDVLYFLEKDVLLTADVASIGYNRNMLDIIPVVYEELLKLLREPRHIRPGESGIMYSRCNKCHIWLPLKSTYFPENKRLRCGYLSTCRKCRIKAIYASRDKKERSPYY